MSPHQLPEANEFSRSFTHEETSIPTSPIEKTESERSQTKGQRQIDENSEESEPRSPSGTSASHVGRRVLQPDQELVEIKLMKTKFGETLSSEETRSRAIGNFLRGYLLNLFDSVLFPDDKILIYFVKSCDPGYRISKQSVSNIRRRPRVVCFRYLPVTKTSLDFIYRVKRFFPNFDGEELYALSGTHVRYKKLLMVRRKLMPYGPG